MYLPHTMRAYSFANLFHYFVRRFLCASVPFVYVFEFWFILCLCIFNAQCLKTKTKMSTSMQSSQECFNVDSVCIQVTRNRFVHTKKTVRLFLNISFFHLINYMSIPKIFLNWFGQYTHHLHQRPFSLWRDFCAWLHYIWRSICNILIATKHTTQNHIVNSFGSCIEQKSKANTSLPKKNCIIIIFGCIFTLYCWNGF